MLKALKHASVTSRQNTVASFLFHKSDTIFAPLNCGLWDARGSTANNHRG